MQCITATSSYRLSPYAFTLRPDPLCRCPRNRKLQREEIARVNGSQALLRQRHTVQDARSLEVDFHRAFERWPLSTRPHPFDG